jgi:hypothetical protein
MKQGSVVILMLLVSLVAAAQTTHLKFKQDGAFATLQMSPDPLSNTTLSVSRTSSSDTATINYSSFTVAADFNSESFVTISGAIPASDFSGQNTSNLVLDLDTSTLDPSTSINISCTIDLTTFTETCGPGPTGLIHLAFQENGAQRTQVLNFDEVVTLGNTTTRIHQKSDNGSANVQGTIFGTAVSGASATVGVNHGSTMEITRP